MSLFSDKKQIICRQHSFRPRYNAFTEGIGYSLPEIKDMTADQLKIIVATRSYLGDICEDCGEWSKPSEKTT